jgi:hypothetical protein
MKLSDVIEDNNNFFNISNYIIRQSWAMWRTMQED